MSVRNLSLVTVVSAAALLSACAVGPKAPEPVLPTAGTGALVGAASAATSGAVTTAAARDDWWRLYNDP
ncbi:MAG: TolC family protein, partial [Brevundimonas sp.]